jgi:hypothetical protein
MSEPFAAFGSCMRLLIFLGCCLFAIPATAQFRSVLEQADYETPRTFYGGLSAGVNFCQVDGDQRSGYHHVGLVAGPMVYARLRGPLFASMELLFSQKGSKDRSIRDNQYTGAGVAEYDIKLNYAEVPVTLLFKYKPRWTVGAGVTYGRLISSKEEAWDNYPINLHPEINYFRKDDWEWHVLLNYEFYPAWMVSMRFSYSFTSIRDADRIPQGYGGGAQYNNLCSFRLCYFFHQKAEY